HTPAVNPIWRNWRLQFELTRTQYSIQPYGSKLLLLPACPCITRRGTEIGPEEGDCLAHVAKLLVHEDQPLEHREATWILSVKLQPEYTCLLIPRLQPQDRSLLQQQPGAWLFLGEAFVN